MGVAQKKTTLEQEIAAWSVIIPCRNERKIRTNLAGKLINKTLQDKLIC